MYEACCLRGEKDCFAGEFTFERCCVDLEPPGDATCWIPPFNYYTCCEKYQRWFPTPNCFDGIYTFDRCCGGHLAVLQFGLRRRLTKLALTVKQLRRGGPPLLSLAMISLALRFLGALSDWLGGPRADGGKQGGARPKTVVPAASTLRVLATCGVIAWHNLGHCGITRQCEEGFQMDLNYQVMSSFFVIQTDVFFVISAYLLAVQGCGPAPGNGMASAVLAAVADLAAGILRRTARTVPAFVLAGSIGGSKTVTGLLHDCKRLGILTGVTWPYGKPLTWPFGVELVCLVVLQALNALAGLLGQSSALAAAAALLAACLERWQRRGYRSIEQEAWHIYHFAVGAHRLPLCLATFILARVLSLGGGMSPATPQAVANGTSKPPHPTGRCRPCCWGLLVALAWALALAGMAATTAVEWCWMFGPRIVVPWWLYPFPAKLPLIFGCVLLLEASRRAALEPPPPRASAEAAPGARARAALELLERRSLGALLLHELLETRMLLGLPQHQRDLPMFWFQLPGMLFWVFAASSILVWVEEPFRRGLEWCLRVAHAVARGGATSGGAAAWRRAAALVGLVAPAGAVVAYACHRICIEPWPSPCFL